MATNQQIREFANANGFRPNERGEYVVDNDAFAGRIYDVAKERGYSANELDTAFGWDSGTSAGFMTRTGRAILGAPPPPPPPPAPAPAPAAPAPPPMIAKLPDQVARTGLGTGAAAASDGAAAGNAPMLAGWYSDYIKSGPGATAPVQAATQQWNVDPATQTVQGQLQGILNSNSPLMRMAQTRADQQMNRRGLMNSSMAVQAGQAALYDAATPIATSDAQMYGRAAETNTTQGNETNRFNAGQTNSWNNADIDRRASGAQFAADLGERARQANLQAGTQRDIADLQANTQLNIAGMDYDIADRRMSQEDRQFIQTIGLEGRKLDTAIDQFAKRLGLDRDSLELEKNKFSAADRQFYDQLKLEKDKLTQQAEQFNTEWSNRFSLAQFEKDGKIQLAQMDADNRVTLAGIEAQYKNDIAREQNVSNAWGTMLTEIGRIQGNNDMDGSAKSAAIQNIINGFQSYARQWKVLSGGTMNVDDLLSFGISSSPAPAPAPTPAPGGNVEDTTLPPGGGD